MYAGFILDRPGHCFHVHSRCVSKVPRGIGQRMGNELSPIFFEFLSFGAGHSLRGPDLRVFCARAARRKIFEKQHKLHIPLARTAGKLALARRGTPGSAKPRRLRVQNDENST